MSSRAARLVLASLVLPACSSDVNDGSVNPAVTRRLSLSASGAEASRESRHPDLTPDGRYLVFESAAGDLVDVDPNGKVDVFRKDLLTGEILLVSVGPNGEPGNGDSTNPSISADGTRVAFQSQADNFAATDGNAQLDVFVRKIPESETLHLSQAAAGGPPSGIEPVNSGAPRLSPDGRYVVFVSNGEDLDGSITPNFAQFSQVYRHDLDAPGNLMVSVRPDGEPSEGIADTPDVSADGLYVVFTSASADLVDDDVNGADDVFLREIGPAQTVRLSVEHPSDPDGLADGENAGGGSRNPRITPDGRVVVFESDAPDLDPGDFNAQTDVFRLDRSSGEIRRVSRSLSGSGAGAPCVDGRPSADGLFVAYRSLASNLVAGDTNGQPDHFWHDVARDATYRLSVRTGGAQSFASSEDRPVLTADGRYAVFASTGPDLVVGDLNGVADVFMRGPLY